MAFDRSKYQKTKVTTINQVKKTAEATMFKNDLNYAKFYPLKEGFHTFRVMPAADGVAYRPQKTVKLDVERDKKDEDGNVIGKEIKPQNIFTADIHSSVMEGKDPVLLYISYAEALAENEFQDNDEKKKFLAPIHGWKDGKGWNWGITAPINYVAYVRSMDDKQIYRLNLRKDTLDEMTNVSLQVSEGDVMSTDIFSDPEQAYPLVLQVYRDDKGKSKIKASAGMLKQGQSWDDFFAATAISDEEFQKLESYPSLKELYVDSYSRKEFDMAIDGLSRFDEKHGYGIFGDEAFLLEIEELDKLVPEKGVIEEEQNSADDLPFGDKSTEQTAAPAQTEAPQPIVETPPAPPVNPPADAKPTPSAADRIAAIRAARNKK